MKRSVAFLVAMTICALPTAYAAFEIADRGTWSKSWPEELEPLRKQARTSVGPVLLQEHYDIPFSSREQFESAWPHLLKVKSEGAPIILVQSPDMWLGNKIKAGVRVHAPPDQAARRAHPEAPLPGERPARHRWMWTTFIELIVDGEVVDLNRIPLPADTPIVDERFKDGLVE